MFKTPLLCILVAMLIPCLHAWYLGGNVDNILHLVLAMVCLVQFAVSILIDRRYEKDLWKTLFWTVWYPMVFWLVSLFTDRKSVV